jgi:hypothetical protein
MTVVKTWRIQRAHSPNPDGIIIFAPTCHTVNPGCVVVVRVPRCLSEDILARVRKEYRHPKMSSTLLLSSSYAWCSRSECC